MTRVFIRYEKNVVSVDTSFGRGPQRDLPLEIVGDLIAAFFPNTAPNELGQYTLYSINNGVETSYNSWDLLTLLGDNGKTGPNPLIIRSLNDPIENEKISSLNIKGILF